MGIPENRFSRRPWQFRIIFLEILREPLINSDSVIPAEAGIQKII